jgi:alpha-tubulin suppressor-like RCC1 family protein
MGEELPFVDLGTTVPVKKIVAGSYHTCVLFEDGRIKCWGANTYGQLGLGLDPSAQAAYQAIGDEPGEMGAHLPFVDLGPLPATDIAAGAENTCAILADQTVKCWGRNYEGTLGLGDSSNRGTSASEMGVNLPPIDLGAGARVLQIDTNADHSCALLEGGAVKCWGYNLGDLGYGDLVDRGILLEQMGDALSAVDLGTGKRAIRISLGLFHSCAVLEDQSVKCWGKNESGALGLGTADDHGGEPGGMGDDLPAVDLGTGFPPIQDLKASYDFTCVLPINGVVKCWGRNSDGELGTGTDLGAYGDTPDTMGDALPYDDLGTLASAVQIAVGESYTCALLSSGDVKCWGSSLSGVLGILAGPSIGLSPDQMGDHLLPINL